VNSILQDLYRLQTLDSRGSTHDRSQTEFLRAGIPQGMLSNYDRARARGKKGIALVLNNVCTSCRITVPVAVTASLAAGKIQVCGNCGLYLCLPEPQPAAIAAPVVVRAQPRQRKQKAAA